MPTLPRLHKDEKSPAHHKITYLQACKLDLKESNMYLALCIAIRAKQNRPDGSERLIISIDKPALTMLPLNCSATAGQY